MFMKTSKKTQIHLTSAIIQKIQIIMNNSNKLVAGKMKGETCGIPIKGFVELKAKIHAFTTGNKNECKNSKRNWQKCFR